MAETAAHLSVRMRHRIGALDIDVDFELGKPWTILFGPSGSGKTTILRAIAGLLRPDFARIVSTRGEQSVTLVDTEAGVWTPAHRRGIPLAPQAASLFPHLTVLENMKYGYPRLSVSSPAEQDWIDELTVKLPALFQISHVLDKRPSELSGGEAQRVSLARTVTARRSRLLLLDEPFTGLDFALRDSLIDRLPEWQSTSEIPIFSVTHDVAEVFQLDAEVIKLSDGKIAAQGPVATVLAEERARLLEQLSPAE